MLDSLRFVKYVRSFMDGRVRVRHPALRDAAIGHSRREVAVELSVGDGVVLELLLGDTQAGGHLQLVGDEIVRLTERGERDILQLLVADEG